MAAPRPSAAPLKRPPSERPEREPDTVIGDFQRGREIGKGSFATVYIAKHRTKRSLVAIKVVPQSKLNDKLKANLKSEIRILKVLQHPQVVALISTTETPRYFYLVMEYCHMSDLAQFMKKRRQLAELPETADIFQRYPSPENGGLNEVLVRHFLKQIVSALEALHAKNMIHRDIKPQNLLLNPSPQYMAKQHPDHQPLAASENSLVPAVGLDTLPMLKIADFGFARHLPSTSLAETLCGSPLYMAPEILRYEKYNAKADLWSTGTVLHEMIVGKPPFRANNHVELARKIENADDHIPFDKVTVSRDLKNLTRALLKRKSPERISYERLFQDVVITGDIPGLVSEDQGRIVRPPPREPSVSEISRRMASQTSESRASAGPSTAGTQPPRASPDEVPASSSRRASDLDVNHRQGAPNESAARRKSLAPGQQPVGTQPQDIHRAQSQRQSQSNRRPSIVGHVTAPGRQELQTGQSPGSNAPKMERRPSRSSPLTAPPMVREPSSAPTQERPAGNARERSAQDMQFEREYVVVEKRAVVVNAFADEMDAARGVAQGAMVRRATTQGQPTSVTGAQPASPSHGMQMITNRTQGIHQRASSFEKRYPHSPQQSATNLISNALKAANARLFGGAFGSSPPFSSKGASPPRGYSAFPAYPTSQALLTLEQGNDSKAPVDEDTKIVRITEDAAHRSDVVFGFAEVKYKQLVPAAPSAQDALGIQQIGALERNDEDKDMTTIALVGVSEEALVLYVKTLNILAKTIDLAGIWWSKQNPGHVATSEPRSAMSVKVAEHMNSVVQWARDRFNECLEKSEVVGRRLQAAQSELPEDHPGHPNNHGSSSAGAQGAASTSTGQIHITSGITAEKLMFERAVDMSRSAAVAELLGEDLEDSDLQYKTAIRLMEAVLDADDEPLIRRLSNKSEKPADDAINGMEEKRETVMKLLEGTRSRLGTLHKKMRHRKSISSTPKPTNSASPTAPPTVANTPPR